MSVCIQYSRPASGKNDNEIFGFDVAVTRFLSAYFRHSASHKFIYRPTDMPSLDHIKQIAESEGVDVKSRCIALNPHHPDKNLQSISCIFRPDPVIADLAWQRQQVKGRGFAICGLVHTMSGERIARAVGDLCMAPTSSSDALICPSVAIRDAVRSIWEIQSDYINFRFGSAFSCPMQTPVIPLGIDTGAFGANVTEDLRTAQRNVLGAGDDETVILFVGRLSFATKAHPLSMFLAAERAAKIAQRKIRLVLYGYFWPKDMEPHFRNLATDICKTVTVDFVMNDDTRFPKGLWAAADVFTSLSDNIQESFGLTPIEAMACGLPCVITDWDGYREGVRNGTDGFLIPVFTPPPSAGMAIARMYFNENNYGIGLCASSQSTAVDIEACASAYALLAAKPDLRRAMGQAAQIRARETFDWKHVIRAYEDLWRDLAEQRQSKMAVREIPENWPAMHPAYPNPFEMFKSFPTTHLEPGDVLRIAMSNDQVDIVLSHEMNLFVPSMLLSKTQLLDFIDLIRKTGAARIHDILIAFPHDAHDLLWRCMGWMLKCGIVTLERPKV